MKHPAHLHSPQFSKFSFFAALFFMLFFAAACGNRHSEPMPDAFKQSGSFIKTLPYFNPDSCVMLVRRDVPPRWQGAAYENLILDGPENSPLELGFQHLDFYEKNFPADSARAFAQLWRGRFLMYLNRMDSAQTCLQDALEISQRIKNPFRESDVQREFAMLFDQKGNTLEALRAYLAVYDAVKDMDSSHTHRKFTAMINVAGAYLQIGNNREVLAWANRALRLVEDENVEAFRTQKVTALRFIGAQYNLMEQPDSAITMLKKSLELSEKYRTNNDKTVILRHLGAAFLTKNDCPTALQHLLEAQRTQRGKDLPSQLKNDVLLAKVYFCLGRLDSAEILFKSGLQSPNALDNAHTYAQLGKLYGQRGNFRAAYEAFQKTFEIQQKYVSVEKIQEMGAAKVELQLKNAQLEIEQLDQKHKNERQQKLIVALGLALGLGFLLALFLRQRSRSQILNQEKQILEKDKILLAQEKDLAEAREILKIQELERSQADLKKSKLSLKNTRDELETATRLLNLKNQLLEELQMQLRQDQQVSSDSDENIPAGASNTTAQPLFRMKILTDHDWQHFRARFEEAFPGFRSHLKSRFSDLTAAETRLFLLYKLNFDTREISETLGISVGSVYRSRHRLAKKLGIADTNELDAFVQEFG